MALSGAFTGTTGNQYIFPTIKWSAVQSQDGNYSDVTATLYYSRSNSGYTTSGTWSGGITIDGQWTAGSRHIEVSWQSGTLAMSATVRVYHDADGSRSVTISAAGYISGTTLSSTSISATVTLDTIPRASVPTTNKSSIAMGEEIIIYTNRKNTAFCHTARYTFAGQAGDIADFDAETAWNWYSLVPKKSLANRIPNAASGVCTVYIKTWSDGNLTQQIGEEQSVSFTLTVPADAKPVVSTGWAAAAADNSGGKAAALSTFVSGFSRAQVTFSTAKIAPQYGASIRSYKITCGGVSADASPYKTGVLSGTSASIVCRVTDSRGLYVEETLTVSLYSYAAPALTGAKLYRSDDAMLPADTGLHIAGVATAKFSSCGGENVCTIKGYWRAVGGSWSAGTAMTSGAAGLVTGDVDILTTASYEAKIEITDKLGNTASFSAVIPTADVAFHLRPGGKGAAFGKYSEKEALEVAWPAEFQKGVTVSGKDIWELIYPVGAIYISAAATDPNTLFGGTWTRIKDRFLLAAGDTFAAGKTGGEASHTLTVAEMPAHGHSVFYDYSSGTQSFGYQFSNKGERSAVKESSSGIGESGGGGAHNNMPPYLTVYVWQRTA